MLYKTTKFLFGILFIVLLPIFLFRFPINLQHLNPAQYNSLIMAICAYVLHQYTMHLMTRFPGNRSVISVLPSIALWYGIFSSIIIIFRLDYSILYLTCTLVFNIVFSFAEFIYDKRIHKDVMAYIPVGKTNDLDLIPNVQWIKVNRPRDLNVKSIKAIVADLHAPALDNEWQKFLADQTLKGTPVYNVKQVVESMTGRIKINHMYENNLGSLLPSPGYMVIKQIFDIILVLLSFPIVLPIMLLTAITIKLESEGPALFIQNRVGQGGKEFRIYKFRSMGKDSEKHGAQMATTNDMRVTRVGKFIRKTRIDELPQFFNVLKGDMSLIGPRPEQKVFVDQFEQEIPFYNYRHIVKPGTTGWAQVTHGYAGDADETRVKIEHDFYYIKHISFSLDILIVFKTVKTMLTGFGAR